MEKFDSMLSPVIDSTLGQRCSSIFGYQFSEIVRSLMSVYFCGGSCVEDVTSQLMRHLSYHPTLRTCSSDTILRAIKEGLKGTKTEDGKEHNGDIKDLDDAFKKEIEKAVDQDAQTSEYLSVTCFEDGWPSSVLKQNKSVIAGRGKLKQKVIEACRFAQREK